MAICFAPQRQAMSRRIFDCSHTDSAPSVAGPGRRPPHAALTPPSRRCTPLLTAPPSPPLAPSSPCTNPPRRCNTALTPLHAALAPLHAVTRAGESRQESVFQWILALGLELRTSAKEFSWQRRLGPYRLDTYGPRGDGGPSRPLQQMSSPYIARGCRVHQHPAL